MVFKHNGRLVRRPGPAGGALRPKSRHGPAGGMPGPHLQCDRTTLLVRRFSSPASYRLVDSRERLPMRASGAVCPRNHGLRLPGPDLTRAVRGQRPRLYREASPAVSTRMSGWGSALWGSSASYGLVDSRERCPCARLGPLAPGTTPYGCLELTRGRRPWLPASILAVHKGCLEPPGVGVLACTDSCFPARVPHRGEVRYRSSMGGEQAQGSACCRRVDSQVAAVGARVDAPQVIRRATHCGRRGSGSGSHGWRPRVSGAQASAVVPGANGTRRTHGQRLRESTRR